MVTVIAPGVPTATSAFAAHSSVGAVKVHVQSVPPSELTYASEDGSVSVTTAFLATDGPALVTCRVKVSGSPTRTVSAG